jgi:hypothetical protein
MGKLNIAMAEAASQNFTVKYDSRESPHRVIPPSIGFALMRRNAKLLFLLIATLLLFADVSSAAEKSLESIHDAWRRSLKGVQIFGIALQELDADAKACGLERMALANALRSALKNTPLQIIGEYLQLFNMFVEIATLHAGERCTSTISLRVSAFVDPTYAPLLAAEITPWSQRAFLVSSREDSPNKRRSLQKYGASNNLSSPQGTMCLQTRLNRRGLARDLPRHRG